jgi:hypothetical protein
LKISAEPRIISATGGFVNSATLKPVAHKGYWRVKMAWPDRHHFFGKFLSQEEAEKWIEQHCWLTEQRQKPNVTSRDKSNDR